MQKLRATVALVDEFNNKLAIDYDALFRRANTGGGSQHCFYKKEVTHRRDELASIRKFVEAALAQNSKNLPDCASEIAGYQEHLDAMKESLRTEMASVGAQLRT